MEGGRLVHGSLSGLLIERTDESFHLGRETLFRFSVKFFFSHFPFFLACPSPCTVFESPRLTVPRVQFFFVFFFRTWLASRRQRELVALVRVVR